MRVIARICLAVFVGITIALSFLRPDLSLRDNQISDFLSGNYAYVAVLAFLILGAGATLIAVLLYKKQNTRTGLLIGLYAATVLVAGLTQPREVVHNIAALVAFASIPLAISCDVSASRIQKVVWIILIVATFVAWPIFGVGLGERLTVYLEILWLATGLRLDAQTRLLRIKHRVRY